MSAEGFSLHHALRDADQATEQSDPQAVAETAYKAIRVADRAEALRQALAMLAPHYVTSSRPTGRPRSRRRPRSATAVSTAVHRFLDSREFSPLRGWIRLSEATRADIQSMAEARYAMAEDLRAKGDWYQRIDKEMAEHGVDLVGDLPEAVVEDLMDEGDEEETG